MRSEWSASQFPELGLKARDFPLKGVDQALVLPDVALDGL